VSSADKITVEWVPAVTDDVRALIGELDQVLSAEYPPEQRHGLALDLRAQHPVLPDAF
jgi:putative acetyltransferase